MIGLLVDQVEVKELEYLLKREMDEILFDVEDARIDHIVKHAMEERYQILFRLFKRIADPTECSRYVRTKKVNSKKG